MTETDSPPAIDFSHLKQYVGDDAALTKELFGMFRHQTELWVRGLDVESEDESWSAIMHSLKGSARAVGALQLAAHCEKGEGLTGEMASAALRIANLQDVKFAIEAVNIEIQRWEYRQTLASLRS